jgi:endoglucanase
MRIGTAAGCSQLTPRNPPPTRLAKFWTQIANTFKYYDDYLLFAGTNEVMVTDVYSAPTAENIAVQNGFNQVFVNTVRSTGSNNAQRHLIVQGYNTNIDYTYATNTVPTDSATSRLMMEVHFYDPYNFIPIPARSGNGVPSPRTARPPKPGPTNPTSMRSSRR